MEEAKIIFMFVYMTGDAFVDKIFSIPVQQQNPIDWYVKSGRVTHAENFAHKTIDLGTDPFKTREEYK